MAAPEKIYAYIPEDDFVGTASLKKGIPHQFVNVAYTRTDAFIEKACELLVDCIEDFMLRRMEVWDEECKKQTLENIRKKLTK